METKPLVTCHGDQSLFSTLHPPIVQGLPRDPTEWRRSYGRAPKTIQLEASFVPYDSDILPDENDRCLVSRPFFHIFWTACDLESYKQVVRDELMEWQAALKSHNIPDWLIVVVVTDESKVKTKLLPRSSVIDKVRNDFCNKQPDRCVVLYEPSKSKESKSEESWSTFFTRLRQLLLQACTRTLGKFEDNMRAFREKRNETGWSFIEYFLVQEELAFMFEMMGVYEDALVQYDELDALFTQFVLNQAAGGTAAWLSSFSQPCLSWAGLSLAKSLDRDNRDLIKQNQGTLLDFRNYLFSRQCALLLLMKRPGEAAQRAMEYLHNTVQEMDILEISLPEGAVACWVFLSALEVLSKCEKYGESSHNTTYCLYTATLWDYARKKLKELGVLCGLMPGLDSEPTSAQLNRVVDLLVGFGREEESGETRPMDKLREALSSKDTFQKHYLELSELAMGTFKHIGRLRSARLIGKDLADFYMKLGEPQKAEMFLVDALKMYKHEGWDILAENIRLDIAKCQQKLANKHKYLRTACHIACCSLMSDTDRSHYQQVLYSIATELQGDPILLKAQTGFMVQSVRVISPQVISSEEVEVELNLYSKFVQDIPCDSLRVAVSQQPVQFKLDSVPEEWSTGGQSAKHLVSRQDSTSSGHLEPMMTFHSVKSPFPSKIEIVTKCEKKDKNITMSGLFCPNSHALLKRGDSGTAMKSESALTKDSFTQALSMVPSNIIIKPGLNTFFLKGKTDSKGVYKLNQLCMQVRGIEFVKSPVSPFTYYQVIRDEPSLHVKPSHSEFLIAGIDQEAMLTLYTGNVRIAADCRLALLPCPGVKVSSEKLQDDWLVLNQSAEPGSSIIIPLTLQAELRPKSTKTSLDYKLTFEGSWLPEGKLNLALIFQNPFRITHKLHTAKDKKFVQVLMCSETETEFSLSEVFLSPTNSDDVELLALNKPGKLLKVTKIQSVSYLWQLKNNIPDDPLLQLELTFQYRCPLDGATEGTPQQEAPQKVVQRCVYPFTLENYKTLYSMRCEVFPQGEEKSCQVGMACSMHLHLTSESHTPVTGTQLLYEVPPETAMWAVIGKTTGVISHDDIPYSVELQATPLTSGYLPYPKVKLFQYRPPDPHQQDIWVKRPSEDGVEAVEKDADSLSVTDSAPTNSAPFSLGQVYYSSVGRQMHVYPVTTDGDLEISMA